MTSMLMLRAALALSILALGMGDAQTVREGCAADTAKFCPEAHDLPSRVQCMNAYQTVLSEGCRRTRQADREAQVAKGGAQDSVSTVNSTPLSASASSTASATPDGGLSSIASRIANHGFPSIFAPWNIAQNLRSGPNAAAVPLASTETQLATIARHDLYFNEWGSLGLRLTNNQKYVVLTPEFTPQSIEAARSKRAALLAANPNILILVNVHYVHAGLDYLPPDSSFWKSHEATQDEYKSVELDFSNLQFQDKVAALCAALVKTGVYDGCMLDGWHDDQNSASRVDLIRRIRAAIGEDAILMGNVNQRLPTLTAPYLNGMYMEGYGFFFFPDWHMAAANLLWGEHNLRKPAITALEGWYPCDTRQCSGDAATIQQRGRGDSARMRAVTTLALAFSNGSVVFSDPNPLPTPDHLHDWYPFWDKSLGRPVGPLATLDRPNLSGAYTRQYQNGEVVFNPPSNRSVTVTFPEPRRSAATNTTGRSFIVAPGDGDLFLR